MNLVCSAKNFKFCPPKAPVNLSTGSAPSAPLNGSASLNSSLPSRDLYFGLSGDDVKVLQEFLIIQKNTDLGKAGENLKKSGATGKFLDVTKAAVIAWQKAVGIAPASGYFGAKSRAKIDEFSNAYKQSHSTPPHWPPPPEPDCYTIWRTCLRQGNEPSLCWSLYQLCLNQSH